MPERFTIAALKPGLQRASRLPLCSGIGTVTHAGAAVTLATTQRPFGRSWCSS
jgi:hypothetical protein